MKINLRHANAVLPEKLRDLDVMPVFFALQIIFHQDQSGSCRIRTAMDPIKFPVRTSFFDRPDFYLIDIQTRKMHSRLSKKQRRSHSGFRCRCCDGCRWPFFGSGQYNPEADFGKQFVRPATKLCLQGSLSLRLGNVLQQLSNRVTPRWDRRTRWSGSGPPTPRFSRTEGASAPSQSHDELPDTLFANQC